MKRIYLVFLYCSILLYPSFGQFPFSDGQIFFKDGTSLNCQVQLALGYDSLVTYKANQSSKEITAKVSDIQTLSTPYNKYDNISIDGIEFLLRRISNGTANLYSHTIKVKPEPTSKKVDKIISPEDKKKYKKTKSVKLEGSSWFQTQLIYVIILNEKVHVITEANFTDLTAILMDKEDVVKKIKERIYTFNDMNQIIDDYNM